MAELIIRMEVDRRTGRPTFRVGLASDDDTPNLEHEQIHRALLRRVFGGADSLDVERESRPLLPTAGVG